MTAETMFEKIWNRHRVLEREDGQTLLYVDRHLVHDGSAPAFEMLREHSRAANRKLVDVATAVVDGHRLLPKHPQLPPQL